MTTARTLPSVIAPQWCLWLGWQGRPCPARVGAVANPETEGRTKAATCMPGPQTERRAQAQRVPQGQRILPAGSGVSWQLGDVHARRVMIHIVQYKERHSHLALPSVSIPHAFELVRPEDENDVAARLVLECLCGQHAVSTRSAHGQHAVSSWSARGQHAVSRQLGYIRPV